MAKHTKVSAAQIRTLVADGTITLPAEVREPLLAATRGRISREVIAAAKAHGYDYVVGAKPESKVTLVTRDKNGRKRSVEVTQSRARELAGLAGKPGRLSNEALERAGEALTAEKAQARAPKPEAQPESQEADAS